MRLEGKTAVVVGGGQVPGETVGNGRAVALTFAREGARVLVVDRDEASAAETVKLIEEAGGWARSHRADVVSEEDCERIARVATEELGRVDILHNNVGIVEGDDSPLELGADAWHRILDVNLTGMWLTCKHVIPLMRAAGGGSVINISSIAALMLAPAGLGYSTTKAAVNSLTKVLARDNARFQVRVNAILPGLMDTPLGVDRSARAKGISRAEVAAERAALVPMGRQGTGWETASAALFFASDESSFVTGQLLAVDGGHMLEVGSAPKSALPR